MSLLKYSYPIVFGTFVLAVSTTFVFRHKLLPVDLQAESNKFYHSEDRAGRQMLAEAIKERSG